MDLDTTEKTISVIVGVIVIGSTLYAVFGVRIHRFVRRRFARRHRQQGKQCPRCRALHGRQGSGEEAGRGPPLPPARHAGRGGRGPGPVAAAPAQPDPERARRHARRGTVEVELPDASGLDTFRRVQEIDGKIPVIFITGHGTTATAIEAMRLGADEYLLKPLELDQLTDLVDPAFEISRLMRVPAVTRATLRTKLNALGIPAQRPEPPS